MVKYSDLVKVRTYEQREEISRLEEEIKQIKKECLENLFSIGTKVFYYDTLDDETIKGVVVGVYNESVKVEVHSIDNHEVAKHTTYFNPNELCKGEY